MTQLDATQPDQLVSTRSTGVRYGVILGVVSIAFFLVMRVAGTDPQSKIQWLSYVFIAGAIFLAHKYYKDNGDGFMSYSQGMGISFWLGLVSGIIGAVFTYIYIKFIDGSFIQQIKDAQVQAWQEAGMSDDQIDQAAKIADTFTSPEVITIFALVGSIVAAVLLGLLISAIMQNRRPEGALDA